MLFNLRSWVNFQLPEADVRLMEGFMDSGEATALFEGLKREVSWRQDTIRVYGKEHELPRLQQWYGDPGAVYTWSGIRMEPLPWTERLDAVRRAVQAATRSSFNVVLLNRYRSGQDTVGWHSDNEPELGTDPVIASLSLGAERDFVMRHGGGAHPDRTLCPRHGSLLLMGGTTQSKWQHCLPRRTRVTAERINLTFRRVYDLVF